MADPIWPVSLPAPLRSGYGVSGKPPLMRTPMESGPDRVTRISSAYPSEVTLSLLLTEEQAKTFESFFENGANAGARWFEMPINTGGGLAYHRVRIVSKSLKDADGDWRVSMKVETEDRVIT